MILVFGKSGQVALELARNAGPREMLFLDRADADLRDGAMCQAVIARHQPRAVIIAAAYTAVDLAEEEPDVAMTVNGRSVGAIASMCATLDIPVVHISTDYVFDGAGNTPHLPGDPTGPINHYGQSKLAGENAIMDIARRYAILRTSWVFSAHGANFVKTMLRLSETKDALNIVADQIGGPTPAADIAKACLTLADRLISGQTKQAVVHFSGAPDVSWAEFAREIFDMAGQQVQVSGIPTSDYPTPARRPLNSRLDCTTLADLGLARPDWRIGLRRVLNELEVLK
ncbi:MAG: dTDP-4-dehydrorhamnose reductase [Pelagimonas sp.]|jgi:dTDP-4-dehydrorhamnose reductase|nr:dTDP-4-dehydrorhamnose reductase [Pelagimonas sp.]